MNNSIIKNIFHILSLIFLTANISVAQSKQIAVTIDDLPLNGAPIKIENLQKMTAKILSVIKKNQIPTVGFVNESLLYVPNETDARIEILKMWTDSGVELGNHTFSHLGFKDASLSEYEDEFVRGQAVMKKLLQPNGIRYFRHPFLQMGATREIENSFENFIAERGCKIVPITMDTMDWMFLAAYSKALNDKNKDLQKRVSAEYLKFVALKINAGEANSKELFGRNIKQILLLHANELNADNFDALVKIYKDRNYQFITVEEALKDSIYRFPDKYAPTSDWLSHWAFSLGKKNDSPMPPQFIQHIFYGK